MLCCAVLCCAVLCCASSLSSLADIISALNEQQEQFRRRMYDRLSPTLLAIACFTYAAHVLVLVAENRTDISNFMDDYSLPEDMQRRVRMCVQYTFGALPLSLPPFICTRVCGSRVRTRTYFMLISNERSTILYNA